MITNRNLVAENITSKFSKKNNAWGGVRLLGTREYRFSFGLASKHVTESELLYKLSHQKSTPTQ